MPGSAERADERHAGAGGDSVLSASFLHRRVPSHTATSATTMSHLKTFQLGSSAAESAPHPPLREILNLNDFETAAEANLKPKVSLPPLLLRLITLRALEHGEGSSLGADYHILT